MTSAARITADHHGEPGLRVNSLIDQLSGLGRADGGPAHYDQCVPGIGPAAIRASLKDR